MADGQVPPIVLDADDPDQAARELYEQLTLQVLEAVTDRLGSRYDDMASVTPADFADALAFATRSAILDAFQIGRAWQEGHTQHMRIHDLEHGGANN